MASRIGPRQIKALLSFLSPTIRPVILSGPVERSLAKRGLIAENRHGLPFWMATAAGYRAIADAIDSGAIDAALESIRAASAARLAKAPNA